MKEFSFADVKDVISQPVENYRSIKPENEMSIKELNAAVGDEFSKAATDHGVNEVAEQSLAERNLDPIHEDCLTTSAERLELADRSRGEWSGEAGNSTFRPEKQEALDALEKYNQEGIKYQDGEPDFSKISEATVEIEDMTPIRPYNFKQADEVCARQWNEQAKDGRTDWTARDVKDWRTENKYSWHERLDMKTMDLVQRDVHEECRHYGGVAECRRHEALNGGGFDE